MRILAVECSAVSASVALMEDGQITEHRFVRNGLTHSQTLMPMLISLLEEQKLSPSDIDAFAVASGPGSFTGVRIGVSAVKGLAFGAKKPCIKVSSLEAMAYNAKGFDGVVCCAMDARCNQVYNALFTFQGETDLPIRLCEDRAIFLPELLDELKKIKKKKIFVGDGAVLCYNSFKDSLDNVFLPEKEEILYQNAASVALASLDKPFCSADELLPFYLRPSQAERQRKSREEMEK